MKTRESGTFWIGEVLDEPIVAALDSWIRQDTPMPVPENIAAHVFDRRSVTDEPDAEPVVEFVSLQRGALR